MPDPQQTTYSSLRKVRYWVSLVDPASDLISAPVSVRDTPQETPHTSPYRVSYRLSFVNIFLENKARYNSTTLYKEPELAANTMLTAKYPFILDFYSASIFV